MANNATYVLKANGNIEPGWLQGCLKLFQVQGISIRKLLLLKNGCPKTFSMLEIHFMLPRSEQERMESPETQHPFLVALQVCMTEQSHTTEHTLTQL